MAGDQVHRLLDLGPAAALDARPEKDLVAVIVPVRVEREQAVAAVIGGVLGAEFWILWLQVDADPGEDPGQRLHVALAVAGADAHRVQLHDLAGVVLVQVARRVGVVVEVAQHGRVAQARHQQVAEMPEHVRADRRVEIVAHRGPQGRLALVDVEPVEPEPRQPLAQLVRAVERPQHPGGGGVPRGRVQRGLERLLGGLPGLGIGQLLGGLGLRVQRLGAREQAARRRQRVDLGLRGRWQARLGRRMQLRVQPARPALGLEPREGRGRDAPGQRVQECGIGRHAGRRRIGRTGPGARRGQQQGGDQRTACCGPRHRSLAKRGSVGGASGRAPVPDLKGRPMMPASLPISGLAATRSRDPSSETARAPRAATSRRPRAFAPC